MNMSKKSSNVGIAVKYTNSNHLLQRKKVFDLPVEGFPQTTISHLLTKSTVFFYLHSHSTRLNSVE